MRDGDTKNKVTVCLGNPPSWNFVFHPYTDRLLWVGKGERTFCGLALHTIPGWPVYYMSRLQGENEARYNG